MIRKTPLHFDVLVIGGGPAGMASAARAAECGVRVGIVDDNFKLGGQIWRGHSEDRQSVSKQNTEASKWAERLSTAGVTSLCGLRVVHQPAPGVLFAENLDGFCELAYEKLVLATGA
ncbi:MAG: FAD-dependent oxidoreductase, partial [Candidatus Sulfotelmatobacter sp.]